MDAKKLTGWNFIVYSLIKSQFGNETFRLKELYSYEKHFQIVYPKNTHIKDKLRQILQNLRDMGYVHFKSKGIYQMVNLENETTTTKEDQEVIYLLANESIPEWLKIGRTSSIERRLKELYNTSVPLPFKVIDTIQTNGEMESDMLEKSIHSVIDTLNPSLRKDTEARRREFFKMTTDEGKSIFKLVSNIIGITPNQANDSTVIKG